VTQSLEKRVVVPELSPARVPLVQRIALRSAHHPWRALAAWLVLVVACALAGSAVGERSLTDVEFSVGDDRLVASVIERGGLADPPTESVLVTARSGRLDEPAARAVTTQLADELQNSPAVAAVRRPVLSADGSTLRMDVQLTGTRDQAADTVEPVLAAVGAVDEASVRVQVVGGGSLDRGVGRALDSDFQRAELLSVPVALVVLVVAFGALLAAGVPVLLALSSVVAALGLGALASHLVPLSETTNSVVLLIGMAVGVDYSLFYVRRAREERAHGASQLDAVARAAATSGHAVVVSGMSVCVAMAGLLLAGVPLFSSMAVGTVLVVAVAVLGALVALPAVLVLLGDKIDRPRVPWLGRRRARADADPRGSRLWRGVLRPVLARPAVAVAVSGGVLLLLALPALGLRLALPGTDTLPADLPEVAALHQLERAFPSSTSSHVVGVQADDAVVGRAAVAALERLGRSAVAAGIASTGADAPVVRSSADGRDALLVVPVSAVAGSPDAVRSGAELRDRLAPAELDVLPGVRWAASGSTLGETKFSDLLQQRLPYVLGFVVLLTGAVVLVAFRSPVIAATAVALNLLSIGAALGILVLVFQHTWAERLLGFTGNGAITSWLPMFLLVVLSGLSTDYHVFVVSRVREEARAGRSTRDAVYVGVLRTAGVVSSAAAVMVAVFAIFGTLSTLDLKQLGVGLAVAVALDATLVRAVLLPGVMVLLGRANWWVPRALAPRAGRG